MRWVLVACLAVAASGCSGSDSGASAPVDASIDAAACGYAVGQRICDLPLAGHVRNETTGVATSVPEGPFTFRDVFAKGTQKYVFIHTSAFW